MSYRRVVFCLFASLSIVVAEDRSQIDSAIATNVKIPVQDNVTIGGVKFVFNEKELFRNFKANLDILQEEIAKAKADPKNADAQGAIVLAERFIAFCILSSAEFAPKSEDLYLLFDRTLALVGPNAEVPKGIIPLDRLFLAMAAVSFVGPSEDQAFPSDSDSLPLDSSAMTFTSLVHYAKTRIEARQGK